jgi:alginate O-acetyltransferase complex protein AlgJ
VSEIPANLTREEQALAEMARTSLSPACRAVWMVLFLSLLLFVPLFQTADELVQYARGFRPDAVPGWARLNPLFRSARRTFLEAEGSVPVRLIEANRAMLREMNAYETRLEDESWLSRLVLPQAQGVFVRSFKLGNEKAYCGHKGELFYRPDVDFVAGPGFLDPVQMHRRQLAGTDGPVPLEPDPLPAILQFDRELKAAGIQLIVMPVPMKPSLRANGLYQHYPDNLSPPQNPSYETFLQSLRQEGVVVFDCSDALRSLGEESFLKQDTHWTAAGMESAAAALAGRISSMNLLPEQEPAGYTRRPVEVANPGDVAGLLRLPAGFKRYGLERTDVHVVTAADRSSWTRSADADVLLLGDSFSNIYSMRSLNWGLSAGFAEQLSFFLQRPLDRIAFNDNGAYATRRELARRQAAGENPLAGKKVVIWEFASRELAQGDWRKISLQP